MAVFNLFSKRQKALHGEMKDVYRYDSIPKALRIQICYILRSVLGDEQEASNEHWSARPTYKFLVEALRREYGVFVLCHEHKYETYKHWADFYGFILEETVTARVLDGIELAFKMVDKSTRDWQYLNRRDASEQADHAIEELNERFREHSVGYTFAAGEIMRVDSQFLHAEAVKPALALLSSGNYKGAQAEFLSAHEHYRHGRTKEALTDCLKALESVAKTICVKRRWTHPANATASVLITKLFEENLIPSFLTSHFSGLRSTLEAGVPTVRNRLGGHGQGAEVQQVPLYIAGYALNLTASAIVLLAEAERVRP